MQAYEVGTVMDRCAVLVDAGYLLGAAGTLLGGDAARAGLAVDYAGLVEALIAEATAQAGLPVLRVLWYDGARDAQPGPEHRTLRVLPDVKVRLGELVRRDGRLQQKGVDSYLQRDLTTLARNGAVADVVLVGGDEDLRRALEEAQDFGLRVHLWGVEAAAPEYNQSQSLIAEADRRWVISEQWIRRFVTLRPDPAQPVTATATAAVLDSVLAAPPADIPAAAAVDEAVVNEPAQPAALGEAAAAGSPAGGDTAGSGDAVPVVAGHVTPADIARLNVALRGGGSLTGPDLPAGGDDPAVPLLRSVTSARQSWADNEQDATEVTTDPQQVGVRFGQRWASRATAEQRDALLAHRPLAPRHLDGELLRYAERWGVDTWEDEPAKFAVRAGFWDAIAAAPLR